MIIFLFTQFGGILEATKRDQSPSVVIGGETQKEIPCCLNPAV